MATRPFPPDLGSSYQAIFEQYMRDDGRGLLIIGAGRRVIGMNEAARSSLSFRSELPQTVSTIIHDMNVEFAVGDAYHDRRPVTHESFMPDPDRLLRFQIIPILTAAGEITMVLMTVEDITRLRLLETVRKDFVANVSHELRTPVASIKLLVETLQGGAVADPVAAQHFLHRIDVEIDAMSALVEELLELSRLESGALNLKPEPTAINVALDDVVNRLAPMAVEKGVTLTQDIQDNLPPVLADPRRLQQVLMNLVHNAIKFTPEDGEVSLRARRQGRGILVEVVDTGVGMTPAQAARVFERFYKTDPGRKRQEGAGLGLAIARHLVELHGSHLQAVSEPGRGSRFSFMLPLA